MAPKNPKLYSKNRPARGLKVCVLVARFNPGVTARLKQRCLQGLKSLGCLPGALTVGSVPGAFELPLAAKWAAASGSFDAVVCLGAVIRGETPHFELVCGQAASGISRAALDTGVPVIFGVLTCENLAQALERSDGGDKDLGLHAAAAAVRMALLKRKLAPRKGA